MKFIENNSKLFEKCSFEANFFVAYEAPSILINSLNQYFCHRKYQHDSLHITIIATIQGRADQNCLTWSGITIKETHHHTIFFYNIELLHTYCHIPGQSRVELSSLEWYYYPKIPPHHHTTTGLSQRGSLSKVTHEATRRVQ